jgi:ribosomal protein L40E
MVKIPAIAYLLIGVLISVTSMYIEGLKLFFYVGLLFIAIGVFKIVVRFITKPKETTIEKKAEGISQQQQQYRQPGIKVCKNCGAGSYSQARFCYYCGTKL